MANQEQLEILKRGVDVWNRWRAHDYFREKIDLRDAVLPTAYLRGANLCSANLCGAKLSSANLTKADLSYAEIMDADLNQSDLRDADLRKANFSKSDLRSVRLGGANLREGIFTETRLDMADFMEEEPDIDKLIHGYYSLEDLDPTSWGHLRWAEFFGASFQGAYLVGVDFTGANLTEANLRDANLRRANLHNAILEKSDLTKARVGGTIFSNLDLNVVMGLEDLYHRGPSIITKGTFFRSKGKISEIFLRGCGLSDWEIESIKLYNPDLSNYEIDDILYKVHDLRASQAIQISSLFISYSHADSLFVDKLEKHLNRKGVRFWRDIHDMKSGRIETQINQAIEFNRIALIILSKHSLKSEWVEHEVRKARQTEMKTKRAILCPITLDNSWRKSSWPERIMESLKEYNILDFSIWKDDSKFESTFNKLINGLELFYK